MSDKPLEIRTEVELKPNRLDIHIHQEPEEDILLLGEMMHDVGVMHSMLASLPKSAENYRGNLIICRGAAERLNQRCTRLLGDDVPPSMRNRQRPGESCTAGRTPAKKK